MKYDHSMWKRALSVLLLFSVVVTAQSPAQGVAISESTSANADSSALLDVQSAMKGVLIPRLTESQRNAITSPALGLMVFQTDGTPGFYYYTGSVWQHIGGSNFIGSGSAGHIPVWSGDKTLTWSANLVFDEINGRIGVKTDTPSADLDVFGSLEASRVTSNGNVELPATSSANTGVVKAGNARFLHNYGSENVFLGKDAGNTTMNSFWAKGNTGVGEQVLSSLTDGRRNTAVGSRALAQGTNSTGNTVLGYRAMEYSLGSQNIAIGYNAHRSNSVSGNIAIGDSALCWASGGSGNIAIGLDAQLRANGWNNISLGNSSLRLLGAGGPMSGNNIAIGHQAGWNLSSGSNNIYIGAAGTASESDVIRIGGSNHTSTYIAGIANQTQDGAPVVVDANGRLGKSMLPMVTGSGSDSRLAIFSGGQALRSSAKLSFDTTTNHLSVLGPVSTQGLSSTQTVTSAGFAIGVYGTSLLYTGSGVHGASSGTGVRGEATASSGWNQGIDGITASNDGAGVRGTGGKYGVLGVATNTVPDAYAIYGKRSGVGMYSNWAGGFEGPVWVQDRLEAGSIQSRDQLGSGIPSAGTVFADNIVYAWANVNMDGTVNASYGCTVLRVGEGRYKFTYKKPLANWQSTIPIVTTVVRAFDESDGFAHFPGFGSIEQMVSYGCIVETWVFDTARTGRLSPNSDDEFKPADASFVFVLLGRPN